MKKLIILVVILLSSCASESLYIKEQKKVNRKVQARKYVKYVATVSFIGFGVYMAVIEQRGD